MNYEKLLSIEEEKDNAVKQFGDDIDLDLIDYDLIVKNKINGKSGIAELMFDGNILFTVPSENLSEYIVSKDEFNSDFEIISEGGM